MAESQQPHADAPQALEAPHWWWHGDDYIAQGKVSILAIAEVVIAFYVYYFWLIPNTSRPWVTIFSIITVPPLLLRSEKSIQRGLELLKTFNRSKSSSENIESPKSDVRVIFGIGWIVVFVLVLICMDITKHFLSGWTEASKLITGSLAIVFSVFALFIAMIVAGAFYIGESDPSDIQEETNTLNEKIISILLGMILLPAFPIALCALAVGIRIRATVTIPHIKAGIAAFSHNWYETVLVSNIRHAPALLPRAGEVDKLFIVEIVADKGEHKAFGKFAVFTYMVFALLYRWNIKANAWIWLPLAFLLRPVNWERHPLAPHDLPPDSRRKVSAFWSNRYAVTAITVICGVLLSYLLYPYFDSDIQKKLSDWAPLLVKYLPIEKVGIRYVLLWLFAISLVMYLYFAVKLKSDYYKILEEHDKHQKLPSDPDKSMEPIFAADAKRFVRIRWFAVAILILFTYSVLMQFFILQWPDTVGKTVWGWLKNSL